MKRALIIIISTFIVAIACAPELIISEQQAPNSWEHNGNFSQDSLQLPINWWETFQDTTLNNLIQIALEQNRDLAIAVTKVEAAQADIKVVRSTYLPSLTLDAYGENEFTHTERRIQEYYIEPTISWEVSLFGSLRQTNRAAQAKATSALWALYGVRLSIAAEVSTTYFTLQQALSNLYIAEQSYTLRQAELSLIDSMYYYGMSNGVARDQARSLMYSAQSDISLYRRAVEQSRQTLTTLLGINSQDLPLPLSRGYNAGVPHEITISKIPQPISIGIPSDLLERRPDIAESYYAMASAAANVGIARAARFPTISLTGSGGLLSTTLKDLSFDDLLSWSATGEIIEPLYNFGKLKNRERIAQESYMESMYTYEQCIITAISEVENALIAINTYATQRAATASVVESNVHILSNVRALYNNGLDDYLNVIDAERELYASQMDLVSTITEQYISYISLYKALGGGY